jgi:hypothetical protein
MYLQTEMRHCNIIRAIKARTMWWVEHIASMESKKCTESFGWKYSKEETARKMQE